MSSSRIIDARPPRAAAPPFGQHRRLPLAGLTALWILAGCAGLVQGQAPGPEDRLVREIFVPFDALSGVLGGENERVFSTRDEYLALEKEARQKPPTLAPQAVVLLNAAYEGTIREAVAVVRGQVELEVLNPGLHAVLLPLEGVALRAATLDGTTAPVGRNAQGQLVLFVRDAGRHKLEVEIHVPVVITAAQQSLQFRVPIAGSSTLRLAVPGNVEVKSGAQVVDRQYDTTADQTRFELLSSDGAVAVVMSLNNRRLREDRVVLARSVLVSELTTSYERLHASVEMNVLHGAVDRFLFEVPAGFQVTSVASPLLSQWVIRQDEGRDVLEVILREATRGSELLSIAATRTPVVIGPWSMPTLKPREVAGQVAVIGLLAEARLRPLSVAGDKLIRIDTNVLRSALPESIFTAEPGAPEIRPIAAFYAPGDDYGLTAAFEDPRDELQVATHLLLVLSEEQQSLGGGFTLTPQATKQTKFAFRMPSEWQLQRVYGADQQALTYDRYQAEKENRYVVTLPTTVAPGTSVTVYFEASYRSSQWLGEWTSLDVEFPRIVVEQATDSSGAISVQTAGDLRAKPATVDGLTPLDASQRGRFGLADSADELAYEVAADTYRAVFRVERTQPHISTRNYSFFVIREGLLAAHYELVYVIERAHTNRLVLELPDTTPTALSIRGLSGDVQVKEFSRAAGDGKHIWTVLLAKAHTGTVQLAVDFEQHISEADMANPINLPVIRATGVAYQTQMVSVEGDPAIDVDLQTTMRPVDVGELAEAEQMPGRRLLGAFASTAEDSQIQVRIARRDLRPLPAAIVQRAELVTLVSTAGVSQSAARYLLQTKVPYLAIRFPVDAELWSVSLNGSPVKPRRRGDQIVLSLQMEEGTSQGAAPVRDLQVVYESPIADLAWVGQIRTQAPQLWLIQDEQDTGVLVPQVDLVWYLHLPTGYRVSRVNGTVFTGELQPVKSPWRLLAQAGETVGGGMHGPVMQLRGGVEAHAFREAATSPYFLADDVQYAPPQTGDDYSTFSDMAPQGNVAQYRAPAARRARGAELEPPTPQAPVVTAPASEAIDPAAARSTLDLSIAMDEAKPADAPAMAPGMPGMGSGGGMGGMGGMPGAGAPMPGMSGYPGGPVPPTGAKEITYANNRPAEGLPAQPAEGMQGQAGDADLPAAGFTADGVVNLAMPPDVAGKPQSGGLGQAPAQAGEPAAAQQPAGSDAPQVAKYWALQGLRGLSIQLDQSAVIYDVAGTGQEPPRPLAFASLGTDPELDITVYEQSRMTWLAWAVVLAILVAGLMRTHAPVRSRVRWVVLVALVACGLPIVGGPVTEFSVVCEKALLAALALIPLWVVIACFERLTGWIKLRRARWAPVTTTALLLAAAALVNALPSSAAAQDIRELLKPILDEDRAVRIPDDAVVIPYDPADVDGRTAATKVLVPYAKYVELWNLAHPDQKIGEAAPEQPFSCAGASYAVTLEEAEHVVLQGALDIEVFTDKPVDVPLALLQAVITSAQLDGKPARLKALQAAPQPQAANAQQQVAQAPAPPPVLLTLQVEGKGRHRLELSVRVAVVRQGGSRIISAVIPYAEATAVKVTVPEAGTNVHRQLGATVLTETTAANQQVIDATLAEGGRLDINWRAKITPGSVDQALTATSLAVVDVREDGIHVTWRVDFAFGQTDRNAFRLEVPRDYLVELVEGKNVRGWDIVTEGEQSFLNVELLTAVKQNEQITVHLSRRTVFPAGASSAVVVPFVAVPDSPLHRGTVQIRRSTILELQTTEDQGVARTDSANVAEQLAGAEGGFGSPLAVRDYQAYKFTATPFKIVLSVAQIQPQVSAELRTLFRLGETESAMESEIQILAQRRSIYQIRVDIPPDLDLEQVTAAGLSDWSIATVEGQRTLTAFFSTGQTDRFSLSMRGKLSDHEPNASVALPRVVVRDVDQQQGTLVVQVDSSLDVRVDALENCRTTLLERATGWVAEAQRGLARLALEYQGVAYRGTVVLSPRTPVVTCVTVSNIRVTFREIQETILLDFRIAEAGIRQLSFRLPASLRGAHISAPRVREKRVVPIAGQAYDQVTLDLQDAITGEYRVVVENDRAIAPERQLAPLPLVDTGTTNNRYVTLENAGRDEVVVEGTPGMEPVTRQTRQWEQLAARLAGGDFATAYVTSQTGPEVEFGYRTKQREIVKTAGASIGLARTELVLDASGAYRASLLLKVDNRTEPYLEIELPAGAELWTAHVAGQPVKPAHTTGQPNDQFLRIPLIKTAEGDLDFPVVLKYAGQFDRLRTLRAVDIPVVRTVNINVELSQVKLYVPEDFEWIAFEGTATRVQDEDDFAAGYLAYRTQQVEKLTQIIRGSNEFSKSRAMHNVKVLEQEFRGLQSEGRDLASHSLLRENMDSNARALETASEEIEQLKQQVLTETDNRGRLNAYSAGQGNGLATNEVMRLGFNFAQPAPETAAPAKSAELFDQQWLDRGKKPQEKAEGERDDSGEAGGKANKKDGLEARLQDDKSLRAQQSSQAPFDDAAAQQVFKGQMQMRQSLQVDGEANQQPAQVESKGTKESLKRAYSDKIERQLAEDTVAAGQSAGAYGAVPPVAQSGPALQQRTDSGTVTWDNAPETAGRAGLASLDFELPQRGKTYFFTTPRGNVEISARPVNSRFLKQLTNLAWLLALVVAAACGWWLVQKLTRTRRGQIVTAVLLCLAGVLLILLGILPIFGLAMILGGVLLLVPRPGTGRSPAVEAQV